MFANKTAPARFIPENAEIVTRENVKGIAYIYSARRNGAMCDIAIGYIGNRTKPAFHYRYSSKEDAIRSVNVWFDGLAYAEGKRAERRAVKSEARKAVRSKVKVGDILVHSWGYEQTNINFFQVTGVTASGASVILREIAKVKTATGDMTGTAMPVPGQYIGKEIRKIINPGWNGGIWIDMDCGGMSLWDGRAESYSSYA